MRYLILFLLALGCTSEPLTEEEMAKRYPQIQEPRMPVPLVAQLIPRNGGWTGDNQLGYIAKYAPNQRATQTILKLDEWGPPEVWTISLLVKKEFTLYDGVYIKARINFGAGGSTQVVEIDWINGTQISLPMNSVNVEAIFSDVDVTTEGKSLSVGVQLSRGSRSGGVDPRLTLAENIVIPAATAGPTPGQTESFELPQFAKSVYAIPCVATAAEIAAFYSGGLRMLSLSGNNGANFTGSMSGNQLGQGMVMPVSGSMARVLFQNDAAFALNASVVATIDG